MLLAVCIMNDPLFLSSCRHDSSTQYSSKQTWDTLFQQSEPNWAMKTIHLFSTSIVICLLLLWMPSSTAFSLQAPLFRKRTQTATCHDGSLLQSTRLHALIPADPDVEAEVCSTIAHLALDFTCFLSPSRSIIRILSVMGRLFAISADYLPDHNIHPEELIIQVVLLSLALRGRNWDCSLIFSWDYSCPEPDLLFFLSLGTQRAIHASNWFVGNIKMDMLGPMTNITFRNITVRYHAQRRPGSVQEPI